MSDIGVEEINELGREFDKAYEQRDFENLRTINNRIYTQAFTNYRTNIRSGDVADAKAWLELLHESYELSMELAELHNQQDTKEGTQ